MLKCLNHWQNKSVKNDTVHLLLLLFHADSMAYGCPHLLNSVLPVRCLIYTFSCSFSKCLIIPVASIDDFPFSFCFLHFHRLSRKLDNTTRFSSSGLLHQNIRRMRWRRKSKTKRKDSTCLKGFPCLWLHNRNSELLPWAEPVAQRICSPTVSMSKPCQHVVNCQWNSNCSTSHKCCVYSGLWVRVKVPGKAWKIRCRGRWRDDPSQGCAALRCKPRLPPVLPKHSLLKAQSLPWLYY